MWCTRHSPLILVCAGSSCARWLLQTEHIAAALLAFAADVGNGMRIVDHLLEQPLYSELIIIVNENVVPNIVVCVAKLWTRAQLSSTDVASDYGI